MTGMFLTNYIFCKLTFLADNKVIGKRFSVYLTLETLLLSFSYCLLTFSQSSLQDDTRKQIAACDSEKDEDFVSLNPNAKGKSDKGTTQTKLCLLFFSSSFFLFSTYKS